MTSPTARRASRLVARILRRGQESKSNATRSPTASTRCSQLSKIRSIFLVAQGVHERIGYRPVRLSGHPYSLSQRLCYELSL